MKLREMPGWNGSATRGLMLSTDPVRPESRSAQEDYRS
jgi:hypothetical protein